MLTGRTEFIVSEAKKRKKRETKKTRLDPTFGRRQGLSIQDYLSSERITPEMMERYQSLIPRDLASAVYRLIDGDMFSPREDINRLFGDLSYDIRLTLSYRPARMYMASVLDTPDPDPRDFIKLAYLIWWASTFSPTSYR